MALAVVAIGGNSLVQSHQRGTIDEQFANAALTMRSVADLIELGWDVVLTHGNGPQVGNVLLRVELAAHQVYPLPLEIADADTEGGIGYMLQQVLGNELRKRSIARTVVTLVSQVVVDPHDPAFSTPTKPIGPFFDADVAQQKMRERGWIMREDSGRGWRRVVPSPRPLRLVEIDAARILIRHGVIAIAAGGGGVPVREVNGGILRGVEAVVDKDLASALLARELGAEALLISTGVRNVKIGFGEPGERDLGDVSADEMRLHFVHGEFPAGSMGPKVEAALKFLDDGGRLAVITHPECLVAALRGEAGTRITKG